MSQTPPLAQGRQTEARRRRGNGPPLGPRVKGEGEMLVRDRMTTSVCTVSPDTPLERALMLIRSRHIRRLPVLQQGRLVGIVTLTDLMRAQPPPATFLSRLEIPRSCKRRRFTR